MLSSGNGAVEVCATNLLKTIRGTVPYERMKGIDATIIDRPSSTAANDLLADASWVLEHYEPRADLNAASVKALLARAGNFDLDIKLND